MPGTGPNAAWHVRLEWWRRLGFDAAQDFLDDSVQWRPVILFFLIALATLVTFIVLCFDVVPGGANVWDTNIWGALDSSSCERINTSKMIRQMYSAISSFAYAAVGIFIAMWSYFDATIAWQRCRNRRRNLPQRPYTKGPDGNEHVKVTAIATLVENDPADLHPHHMHHPNFVSVDPEYLRGSIPALLRREPLWGFLIAAAVCFLSIGSYLSHASATELGHRIESAAWFSVVLTFCSYFVARALADGASPRVNMCGWFEFLGIVCRIQCDAVSRERGSRITTILLVSVTVGLVVVAMLLFDLDSSFVTWVMYSILAVVAFLALSLHYLGRKEEVDTWYELGLFGVLIFGVALLFARYDTLPALCGEPSGYFQAHAVWQSLSAVAIGFLYLTMRSDMWMYDLVAAREVRRHEAMDEAYRVPGMDFVENSQTTDSRPRTVERDLSASRPRTLDRSTNPEDATSQPGEARRRTIEREHSGSSRGSTKRIDHLRAQATLRNSKKTQKTLDSDSEMDASTIGAAYWTCPECAYEDNELAMVHCERCGAERPPLDEFVAMSVVQGYL